MLNLIFFLPTTDPISYSTDQPLPQAPILLNNLYHYFFNLDNCRAQQGVSCGI